MGSQITSICIICFQMLFAGENSSRQNKNGDVKYAVRSRVISKCPLCTKEAGKSKSSFHHCVITCGYRVTVWQNLSHSGATLQLVFDRDKGNWRWKLRYWI